MSLANGTKGAGRNWVTSAIGRRPFVTTTCQAARGLGDRGDGGQVLRKFKSRTYDRNYAIVAVSSWHFFILYIRQTVYGRHGD